MGVITRFLEEKMRQARYDLLGPGRYVGEVPGLEVRVEAENLEEARSRLREALEERLLQMLRLGLPVEGLGEEDARMDRFRSLVLGLWELVQKGAPSSPGSVEAPEEAPAGAPPLEPPAPEARPRTVEEWLRVRGIAVQKRTLTEGEEEREKVFSRLALFLGDRYSSLEKLYDKLKWSLSTKRQFELSLADASQEEIANSTQFCTLLKQYAFLTSYHYKSEDRLIRAKASTEGFVQNFLTGSWLERYIKEKVAKVLRSKNLPHEIALGYQVVLPGGEPMELDVLVMVQGRVFWFEAKTGEFQAHISKYSRIRKLLGLRPQESFLVLLGMDKARAKELSALHEMTVTNQATFLEPFLEALENA
jgi:hypothetical protein